MQQKQIKRVEPMRKNTLMNHKKFNTKIINDPKDSKDSNTRQFVFQNPESSAKFCLLQISQESPKLINQAQTFTAFQTPNSHSFSSQIFPPQNKIPKKNEKAAKQQMNSILLKKHYKEQPHQSVILKSTFSNEMRKTSCFNLERSKQREVILSKEKYVDEQEKCRSMTKLRKFNNLPLSMQEETEGQKIERIFRNTPSKQILAILKRTSLTRDRSESQKKSKDKQNQQSPSKKKSIFNIRHLMFRDKIVQDSERKKDESPERKSPSPNLFQLKQQHSNNYNVVKMRLKNRYNQSPMERR